MESIGVDSDTIYGKYIMKKLCHMFSHIYKTKYIKISKNIKNSNKNEMKVAP